MNLFQILKREWRDWQDLGRELKRQDWQDWRNEQIREQQDWQDWRNEQKSSLSKLKVKPFKKQYGIFNLEDDVWMGTRSGRLFVFSSRKVADIQLERCDYGNLEVREFPED